VLGCRENTVRLVGLGMGLSLVSSLLVSFISGTTLEFPALARGVQTVIRMFRFCLGYIFRVREIDS
jgi:hypothetical protein